MSDSEPTNENQGVEDFFAQQKKAQAAGDSEERKQWYVEEFRRREEKTRRRTRPWINNRTKGKRHEQQKMLTLPVGLLMLAGLTGCPTKTPTTTPVKKAAPLPGCQVERLEDAEQAVSQVLELSVFPGSSPPWVYKMDGDLATCKLEVFCKPDEESEETLVWSVTGDHVAKETIVSAEDEGIESPHYHHVLAIVVPEGVPKPDDQLTFSFSIRCTSKVEGEKGRFGQTFVDTEEARDIFPESFFALTPPGTRGGMVPPQRCHLKPGEEGVLVSWWHKALDKNKAENEQRKRNDFVRYQVTVTCLEDGKLPTSSDQESEQQPK